MKKKDAYQSLNLAELQIKQQEFIKDLVSSRLSMDVSALTSATNLQNLLRELKVLARIVSIKKKAKTQEVNQ